MYDVEQIDRDLQDNPGGRLFLCMLFAKERMHAELLSNAIRDRGYDVQLDSQERFELDGTDWRLSMRSPQRTVFGAD